MEARLREQSHVIAGAARLRNRACLSGVRVARFTVGSCLHFHPRSSKKVDRTKEGKRRYRYKEDTEEKKKPGYFSFMPRHGSRPWWNRSIISRVWIGNVNGACCRCHNSMFLRGESLESTFTKFYYTPERRDRIIIHRLRNEYHSCNVNFNVGLRWIRIV